MWKEGNVPGTQSHQFSKCFNEDGTYKSEEDFKASFEGMDFNYEDKEQ
jgi:hypothetical protein